MKFLQRLINAIFLLIGCSIMLPLLLVIFLLCFVVVTIYFPFWVTIYIFTGKELWRKNNENNIRSSNAN